MKQNLISRYKVNNRIRLLSFKNKLKILLQYFKYYISESLDRVRRERERLEKEKKELAKMMEKMKLELEKKKREEELEKERQEKLRKKEEQNKRNRMTLIIEKKSI